MLCAVCVEVITIRLETKFNTYIVDVKDHNLHNIKLKMLEIVKRPHSIVAWTTRVYDWQKAL